MTTHSKWRSWQRPTALVLFGLLFTFTLGTISFGQKKTPADPKLEVLPKPDEPYKVVASGYVRPGDVPDRKTNGTTLSAAQNPDQKTNVLGGTVYFAVLKRNQPTGWGLDLEKTFVDGAKSPARLDSAAEYIYLFQLVNDRGLEKGTVKLAVDQEIKNDPISSFVLDLRVPTDEITSWGYFKNSGFVLDVQPDGAQKAVRLSASGNDMIVNHLQRGYFPNATIHPLTNWTIGAATHQLADSDQIQKLLAKQKKAKTDKNVKLMAHEATLLKASQAPHNPVSVEVLYSDSKEMGAFRVDFASRNVKGQGTPLMLGEHSPVFGFTSNRAPKRDAGVRLEDANAAKLSGDGIAMAADAKSGIAFSTQLMPTPAARTPQLGGTVFGGLQNAIDEFVGYTSPGNPSDAVVAKGRQKIDAIGATVYFAVLKLAGNRGDTWGTGTSNFDSLFYNGQSFQNKQSPVLDTRAKYLYLYQLVNDRGIVNTHRAPGTKLTLAADAGEDQKFNIQPIAAMGIELEVDPRAITSWGHFRDTGFTFGVPNTRFKEERAPGKRGGILTIADTPQEASRIQLAASSMPPLLLQFREKRYTLNSPPYSLGKMRPTLSIGSATENLTKTSYYRQVSNMQKQGGIKLAAWQETILAADKGADSAIVKDPTFVQLLFRGYYQDDASGIVRQTTTVSDARTVFRVDWWNRDGEIDKQNNLVKQGTHGPIVGFTSDLPPKWGGLWIENMAAANLAVRETGGLLPAVAAVPAGAPGAAVRTVANLGPAVTAGPSAVALAATPGAVVPAAVPGAQAIAVPVPDGTATPAAAGGTPVVGGIATPAGGGLGGAPGGGTGGGGAIPGGFGSVGGVPGGGGAFGGGTGGGNGGGEADTAGDTGQDQGGDLGGNQTINFNALLTNQQSQAQLQAQLQFQLQLQKQSQNCGCDNGGDVPAPTAVILAILGLPVLFFLRRRKSAVSATA